MTRTKAKTPKPQPSPKKLPVHNHIHPFPTVQRSDNSDRGESPSGDGGEESPASSPKMATLKQVSPKKRSSSSDKKAGADDQVCIISLVNAFSINSSYQLRDNFFPVNKKSLWGQQKRWQKGLHLVSIQHLFNIFILPLMRRLFPSQQKINHVTRCLAVTMMTILTTT